MNAKETMKILQGLADTIDEGVHVVNAEGISIFYTEKMAALEKIRCEDVLGKSFRESFAHIPEGQSTLLKALNQGIPTINKQQTYLNTYGKEVTTVNTTIPIREGKKIIAALEVSKDITVLTNMSNTILDLQNKHLYPQKAAIPIIRKYHFKDIIGENAKFKEVLHVAHAAAKSSAPVFIYGDTGTGKELIAQSIHYGSPRKDRPFLAQNCAAIPESLLEGMLFGTAKGGFTGALDRAGLFEQANGGTLLLDEISAMPYELQSKLLRVLQEEYIRRVGGTKDVPIDVRIIATVNEPAANLLESGKLRKDLYYRLNIVNITLPPLRERKDDILLLVDAFLEKYNKRYGKHVSKLSSEAQKEILAYDYPGNVRELENIIMSAVALVEDETILPPNLINVQAGHEQKRADSQMIDVGNLGMAKYFEELEHRMIEEVLERNEGNISRAAKELKLQRQTLQHKIKKYKVKL